LGHGRQGRQQQDREEEQAWHRGDDQPKVQRTTDLGFETCSRSQSSGPCVEGPLG
jgi:hypothetical protein